MNRITRTSPPPMPERIAIGTRSSPLALAQAFEVRERLYQVIKPQFGGFRREAIEIHPMSTMGDRNQGSLTEIGGKGLFTLEIEQALLSGTIDIAVHSLKDMPTEVPKGLIIAAVPPREAVHDFLILSAKTAAEMNQLTVENLPPNSRIGTSSLRRALQLRQLRADLVILPFRGNIGTRLKKLAAGEVDATVLARAGLNRLGLHQNQLIGATLPIDIILPAVAQGALALETRDSSPVRAWLDLIDHRPSHLAVLAERAMLRVLDGSCKTPIGGLALWQDGDGLQLQGGLASHDQERMIRAEMIARVEDDAAAVQLGESLGRELLRLRGQKV
ncbi:MAG: hydroxymethylbilane synthase [Candidatus Pacebacteria bacterium]|nr:hydroxymethylbilane synthase [Candidatus Paceibacterota bacterium]